MDKGKGSLMMKELVPGVQVHYLPTEKFKTIQMAVQIKMPLEYEKVTARSLLGRLLVTNTAKYATQTAFRKKLAELYGAQLTSHLLRKGNAQILSIHLSMVNDHFVASDHLFEEAMSFLREVLFAPNITAGYFDRKTFIRERENLRKEFLSLSDYKSEYAHQQLNQIYFDEPAQQMAVNGRLEDLEKLTPKSLVSTYEEVLNESQIDILVVGKVNQERLFKACAAFPFKERTVTTVPLIYHQPLHEQMIHDEEVQTVKQAKLNIACAAPIAPYAEDYEALQVFNGLFGGFPHSKLFMEIREKHSLAYSIFSQFDSYRQVLYIQAGIDSAQAARVESLVGQQLDAVKQGDFTEKQFQQTQTMLIQMIKQLSDYPATMLGRYYESLLTGADLSLDQWTARIEAVTPAQVKRVAQCITPQASFVLKGDKE